MLEHNWLNTPDFAKEKKVWENSCIVKFSIK